MAAGRKISWKYIQEIREIHLGNSGKTFLIPEIYLGRISRKSVDGWVSVAVGGAVAGS